MQPFETTITPKRGWLDLNLRELLRYRDLIVLFVRRTFVSQYKQTILGPAWAVIQPLLTTVVLTVVFGRMAGLSPDGVPGFAFYLCGSIVWGYFSACLTATANTFTANAAILGKVYFPRLVMPISTVLSQLISFAVQFCLFLLVLAFCLLTGANVQPNRWVLLTPLLLLQLALLSLGVGVIVSALTTKYRDLAMVVGFGVQLWMYATPVAYDLSLIPERFQAVYLLNPVAPVITLFRCAFLGVGQPHPGAYAISWVVTLAVLLVGILLFNRVEKTFMDTV